MGPDVSVLVTDIVGSTRLWVDHEDAMRADLAEHDRVLRELVARCGGDLVKHTGDGVIATFVDPLAALRAAADTHRALAQVSWSCPDGIRARAAVHSGAVHERDGDVFGPTVNRAARLLAICPTGAVVISSVTAGLVAGTPLDGLRVTAVGQVELRGFRGTEEVYALAGGHLAPVEDLPSIAPGGGVGYLPRVDDELVGRADELHATLDALRDHGVVTLVGVGGMGKTRLAVETAASVEPDHPDGVWWCDLTAATNAAAVGPVVLEAVGGRQLQGHDPVSSIASHLEGRNALVVLDNCEHVLDSVRGVVRVVRSRCPSVRLLATSREALGLPGEVSVPVSSLPPDEATALFLRRARAVRPDVDTSPGALDVMRGVCEDLDRIPLAIELAASRCRAMSPAEIAERVHDRFRLLRGGRATSERHRTLQAAIGWSHSLLDDDERELFDTMAVFAGGSMLDGIAAVAQVDGYDALDIVDRLVARSLVTPVDTPLGTRYRQLETLRQFAEDRLVERGRIDELRDRHLAWVRQLGRWQRSTWGTPDAGASFDRYVAEVDNVRVAVAHALTTGRTTEAYGIIADSYYVVLLRPTFEAADWFAHAPDSPDWPVERAEAHGTLAALEYFRGRLEESVARLAPVPDEHAGIFAVRFWRGMQHLMVQGDLDGASQAFMADEHTTDFDRQRLEAGAIMVDNLRLFGQVDPADVEAMLDRSARIVERARAQGDPIDLGVTLLYRTFVLANGGPPREALDVGLEAESIGLAHGAGTLVDMARNGMALAWSRMVDDATADRSEVLTAVRQWLVESRDRRAYLSAVAILSGTALLLVDDQPAIAYLLEFGRLRMQPGYGVLADPGSRLEPAQLVAIQERAVALSPAELVDLAIDALTEAL